MEGYLKKQELSNNNNEVWLLYHFKEEGDRVYFSCQSPKEKEKEKENPSIKGLVNQLIKAISDEKSTSVVTKDCLVLSQVNSVQVNH
jgi:hypothetical protein